MKCGEIWARSARTSASTSRRRDASSSARSSCPETQAATSSVARTRPAVGSGEATHEVPDHHLVDHQRTEDHVADRAGRGQVAGQVGRGRPPWSPRRSPSARRPARRGVSPGRPRPAPGGCRPARRRARPAAPGGADAAFGAVLGQPFAEGRARERGRVQGPERRPVGLGAEVGAPEEPTQRGDHLRTLTVRLCATRAQGRTTTSLTFFLGLLPVVFLAVPTSL